MSQKCPGIGRCCPASCPIYYNKPCLPPPEKKPSPPLEKKPSVEPSEISSDSPKSRIRILNIDPMLSVNGPQHHTEQFSQTKPLLVARRGKPFLLKFKLDRDYSPQFDAISLMFLLEGETAPKFGTGTEFIVPVFDKADNDDLLANLWYATVQSATDKYMVVKVQASTKCVVGDWKLEIDTKFKPTNESGSYVYKDYVTILFNAWNPSDQVYMEDDQSRTAYVLNEVGMLVTNEASKIPWFFGQFQRNILKIAIHLLSVLHPTLHESRYDAVSIVRALSGALSSNKEKGVLVGKWGDDFSDGINPNNWVGSTKILQEYYTTKLPVKYGQCWVFSAICTTVCRAVGIPARPVTVLDCAHDNDGNFLVDFNFDDVSKTDGDSIWDYHVMTEVWMRRPDVCDRDEYDGWSVVDCTPQARECSKMCGPAPVRAIKHGEIHKLYDVDCIYSYVNADIAYWKTCPTPTKLVGLDSNSIGSKILTQDSENVDGVLDITEKYKFPEGSKEERVYFEKVLKQSENEICRYSFNQTVLLRLSITVPKKPMIGSDFEVEVKILNLKEKRYKIGATVTLYSRDYTGRDEQVVKRDKLNVYMRTSCRATHTHVMRIRYDDYMCFLRPSHSSFSVYCVATVQGCQVYDYFCRDHFSLRKPTLVVNVTGLAKGKQMCEGQEFIVTAEFDNPLPAPLTRGQFTFEGTDNYETIKLTRKLPENSKISESCKWKVKTKGEAVVMASFTCHELGGIYGYAKFSVS